MLDAEVANEIIAEKILQYENDTTVSYYVIEDCTYYTTDSNGGRFSWEGSTEYAS